MPGGLLERVGKPNQGRLTPCRPDERDATGQAEHLSGGHRDVRQYLAIPLEKIEAESKLEDLGLDSLGSLELIFELEEEFHIAVPNERATEFTTVRAVCDGVESLQQSSTPPPTPAPTN